MNNITYYFDNVSPSTEILQAWTRELLKDYIKRQM